MANMAYIRFQNTLDALQDCFDHIEDNDLSDDEQGARQAIVGLCKEIAETYDVVIVNETQREGDEANYQQAIKISTAR